MEELTKSVNAKIGDDIKKVNELYAGFPEVGNLFDDDDDVVEQVEPEASIPDVEDISENFDNYLGAHVMMQVGDERLQAVIKQ